MWSLPSEVCLMGQRDSALGVEAKKSLNYAFPGIQGSSLGLNPGFTMDCVTLRELFSSFQVLNVHCVLGALRLFYLILIITLRGR